MPTAGDGPGPRHELEKDAKEAQLAAWSQTREEMGLLADDRREEGWEVETVVASHTDPVSRDMNDHDRFGLIHVLPNNHAERFETFYDEDSFEEYLIYANQVDRYMFVVLEFLDPDAERSIFLASRYDLTMAQPMLASAETADRMYSHVKTIDGTIIASIPLEEYDALVAVPNHPDN